MKFTEEQAYNELVAELKKKEANPLINKRGIQDIINDDFLLLGESEIELSDYVAKRINSVKSLDGNIRKVAKTQIEDFKKALETNGIPPKNGDVKVDDVTKALQEKLSAIEEKLAQAEKKTLLSEKRKSLKSEMETLGIKDKDWIGDLLSIVTITENTDVKQDAEKYLKMYNKQKSVIRNVQTPGTTGQGNVEKTMFDDIIADCKKKREKTN